MVDFTLTPKFAKMDFSEDSGCHTASSMEVSSAIYESTPNVTKPQELQKPTSSLYTNVTSRKRKIPFNSEGAPLLKVTAENFLYDTPKTSLWKVAGSSKDFFSSTLNDSKNVENFITDSLTPNFYTERSEFYINKQEQEQEKHDCKNLTPPRPEECTSSDYSSLSVNHSSSLGLNHSNTKSNSTQKLGSPERNAILYPEIKYFHPIFKPLTPQKFTESLRRCTPVKKRLFETPKQEKVDPIKFFLNDKYRHLNVVEKIFGCLSEEDLYNVKSVSSTWRDALFDCKEASRRLNGFMFYCKDNKENLINRKSINEVRLDGSPVKAPLSPKSKNFYDFVEHGKLLKEGQFLNKCPRCNYPAIIDHHISQCQRETCGFISCLYCSSCSITGPENFSDKCQTSRLLFDKPEKTKLESLLSDSPVKITSEELTSDITPSHFYSNLHFNSVPNVPVPDNSNFRLSDNFIRYSDNVNRLSRVRRRRRTTQVLHECNRDLENFTKSTNQRTAFAPVVPITMKTEEITEPPSPPKENSYTIGSKASKKNLRRLLF